MGALAMPAFETPEPISAVIELVMADVRVSASDRSDTVVEVRPSDASRQADVDAAEQIRVEYSAGGLLVKATGRWRSWSPFGYGGSVEVDIDLPIGSRVKGVAAGAFRCGGTLGDCQIKASLGDVHVERAAAVALASSTGNINLERATGDAELTTASGEIRAGDIDGTVEIKNSNGDTHLGKVAGGVRVKAANGDISIDYVHGPVNVKTASGDIRIGEVGTGSVTAQTGYGSVEIGVPDGTAAWLDLNTGYGQLRNTLEAGGPPGPEDPRVEIHARSGYGDITIRRCYPDTRIDLPA
jgi:DUF4097 and DUF4098 domain-containing protein YvlB